VTEPVKIIAAGMVTGVGLSAPTSCAAIRCGINNFNETRFVARSGEWIVGSQVVLEAGWRGLSKLTKMGASAVRECFDTIPPPSAAVPVILCLAEEDRPGRLSGLGGPLLLDIERELGMRFHQESSIVAQGRVGGAIGLLRAQKLIHEGRHPYVILLGIDSYLTGPILGAFEDRHRILTSANSDGFVPGEAAAAVVLGPRDHGQALSPTCHTPGFAREHATIDGGEPLRGDGMVEAVRSALVQAGIDFAEIDYRISDLSGEQYRFKELALTTIRLLRERKVDFGVWHPADSIGEVGAAALPVMLGTVYYASRKRYLPGPTLLVHLSNDDDKRSALIISEQKAA
jgi:3-oxoacyl-[acyl-carrier-protein] synthase I